MKTGRWGTRVSNPPQRPASRNEQGLSPPLGAAQPSDAELAPERPRCAAAAGLASVAAGTPPLRAATRLEPSIAPHPLQGSHADAAL